MRKASFASFLGALAMIATTGGTFTICAYPQIVHAQTQGMERRAERRGTRQHSRELKHACNASEGKSRAECRQGKREVKQEGRHD